MRKFFALTLAIVLTMVSYAQTPRILSADRALEKRDLSVINYPTQLDMQQAVLRKKAASLAQPEYSTQNVTSQKIGQASNAFTFLRTDDHQLSFVSGTNSLAFIHRQDITLHGGTTTDNGKLRYAYSTDGGTTWSKENGPSTPVYSYPIRYPNGILTQRSGSTAIDLVQAAATLDGSWDGHYHGYVQDATIPPFANAKVSQEDYAYKGTGTLIPGSLVERVPGEFWYIDRGYDGTNSTGEIMIYKGIESNGVISWSETTVTPPHDTSFDGVIRIVSPSIAFAPSPNENIGWASFLGDLNGDTTYSPVFMKTTDAGANWSAPEQFDMSQHQGLTDSLTFFQAIDTTNNDTLPIGTGKATCGFNADLSVDANGNPHLIAIVGNASSNFNAGGNLAGYSIFSGIILLAYDFTIDSYGDWNMMHLGSVSTLRGSHGSGPVAQSVITADPWVQVTREAAGNYMFFSWTDTDSTSAAWDPTNANGNPDLIGRGYDIHTTGNDKLTPIINWTKGDQVWDGKALMPKAGTLVMPDGPDFTVPYVIMDLETGDAIQTSGFHYFSDITYLGNSFNIVSTFFYNCKENPYASTLSSTDATCGTSDGTATINISGGIAPHTILWSNSATTATITGLAPGIYDVTVTDINGCSDLQQVIVNNANAATLAISGQDDPSCFGLTDGTATATASGGTAPFIYSWSNGETSPTATMLPAGTSSCTVTDSNNCISIVQVTLATPTQINLGETHSDVSCNGTGDGSITAIASGGTGSLEYSIDGINFQTSPLFMGLSGGPHTLTVKDGNGCTEAINLSIAEPAALSLTTSFTIDNGNCDGTASVAVTGGTNPYNYSWNNGQVGPGANFIFGLCAGNYNVYVYDAKGCLDSAYIDLTTSIEHDIKAGITNLTLYPNPASTQLSVSMDLSSNESIEVSIIDLKGRMVASKIAQNVSSYKEQFDLSHVTEGLYLLRINTTRGTTSRKIIVK